ncbi:MAG: GNAT family N-acetyltransferase [Planctomycetaceae bacterium]|nr:GNAT family N-acetyltransferase [Planctomycetaceae bacterium]
MRLEPLSLDHADELRQAAADGELWNLFFTFVPAPDEVQDYIHSALAAQTSGHMLPWAVHDEKSGRVIGATRYHDIKPAVDRVEIGYTWYASSFQRTHINTTCKLLLLEHAFETVGCGVVGFRTDVLNFRSQQAIEALGAKKDGTIRHHSSRKDGTIRDDVFYSILQTEWPAIKQHLHTRLNCHRKSNKS